MAKLSTVENLNNLRYYGTEPKYDGHVLSNSELLSILNWYNYIKNTDNAKKYLEEYCKNKKIKSKVSNHTYENTWGWIARILNMGGKVEEKTVINLHSYLKSLNKTKNTNKIETQQPNKNTAGTNKLNAAIADIDDALDLLEEFNVYEYFMKNSFPKTFVKNIIEYYSPQHEEIKESLRKNADEQIKEAYLKISLHQKKKILKFYDNIIADCDKYLNNTKKIRKPKIKSVDNILKHFKYQENDNNLKISSISPEKILKAKTLYIINTKYNIVTMLVAKDENGFDIHRTAIINVDEDKSKSKRCGRNITKVIESIINGTKNSRIKMINNLKSNEIKINIRINENCILLKIDK